MKARNGMRSRLLTPAETAERLGVSLRWLYGNADSLPFTRRLTPRLLRFEESGLEEWLGAKAPASQEAPLTLVARPRDSD